MAQSNTEDRGRAKAALTDALKAAAGLEPVRAACRTSVASLEHTEGVMESLDPCLRGARSTLNHVLDLLNNAEAALKNELDEIGIYEKQTKQPGQPGG